MDLIIPQQLIYKEIKIYSRLDDPRMSGKYPLLLLTNTCPIFQPFQKVGE